MRASVSDPKGNGDVVSTIMTSIFQNPFGNPISKRFMFRDIPHCYLHFHLVHGSVSCSASRRWIEISFPFRFPQACAEPLPESLLKFLILECVDERVDTGVQEHHEDGEVVEVAAPVFRVTKIEHQIVKLVAGPAHYKTAIHQILSWNVGF